MKNINNCNKFENYLGAYHFISNYNIDKLLFIIMEQYPYLFDTYYSDYKNLFIRL